MKKTLITLTENIDKTQTDGLNARVKLIVRDLESRPEHIEIDNREEKCEVRMSFSDNSHWRGSMIDLNKNLKLAALAKDLSQAVKFGSETDSIIERIINIQNS